MVQFVNVRELKNHVSEVIRRSRKGDVVVTSRGKPQAVLHAVNEGNLEDFLLTNSKKLLSTLQDSYREHRSKTGSSVKRVKRSKTELPLVVERDEDGFYVVECPLFSGCYTQGKSLDQALENIKEVIGLCLEEKANRDRLRNYSPRELSFHTLAYA